MHFASPNLKTCYGPGHTAAKQHPALFRGIG